MTSFGGIVTDMVNEMPSRAELLSDSATYQRTVRGQRKLLQADDFAASPRMRVLARVNGYTDLRGLVELSPDEAGTLAAAVEQLVAEGLIELVQDAGSPANIVQRR